MVATSIPVGFIPTPSTASRSQAGSRTKLSSAAATVTAPIPETPTTATTGMDSIPMDAESRWRDHHMKRQWAQSLLMESMEPVLSRHLRHAIKSVLHFTNAGPEIMDLKGSSSGLGHWDSFATPMVFPPRIVVPHALSNSIQINQQASTPVTATPTQAAYQQLPAVSSSYTARADHIRIPNAQQRTRSASINSLSQLLEAQRAGEAHRSKDPSTSSTATRVSDMATSVSLMHRNRNASVSSVASPTIVVRGFTSTAASAHTRTFSSEEAKSKSTMMVEADDISEIDLGLSESQLQHTSGSSLIGAAAIATIATIPTTAVDSTDNLLATLQSSNNHDIEPHKTGAQNHTQYSNNSGANVNGNNGGNGFDIPTDQDLVPSKPRHSRLWSKMRKVVYGESKHQDSQSRNTVYLATGGGGDGATGRSMTETHLSTSSTRPVSTSATTSYNNIVMPSFSSSVLSVMGEDQISLQKELPKTPTSAGMSQAPKVSVSAFDTPPETAPNSPTQTLTPTSPTTRSRFGFSHNLPGLARRSSTKSPVAAAELTTAESRVSQFMYAGQTSRPESTTSSSTRSRVQSASSSSGVSNNIADNMGQGTPLMDLSLHNDHFSTPNTLERSNFKSALKSSVDIPDSGSTPKQLGPNTQLGRSKSASSAQRRETRHTPKNPTQAMATGSGQKESFHDGEQLLTAHQQFREFGILSPPRESLLKDSILLDATRKRNDESGVIAPSPLPTVSWSGNTRHTTASSPHQQQTSALSPDGRPLSPSQMLSGTSDLLTEQSKQDRRKSALSFGGYFSNTSSAANRRTRDLTGHSISGLETDAQGEIIHLRRTSFFEKASSPPTLTSLATFLHSNLPSLSQNLNGTDSPSLSRSPSKSSGLAQEQRPQLQGRPSVVKESTITTGETDTSKATTTTTPRDLKKRITPLKITPLLLSGVSSLPSPMFPPLSATIPRPLGSSTFAFAPLDRYFFNVDQVHEWNIPSFGRVKFTDHAPLVFHAIRERFHYTLADMDEALSQPMTVMKTPGKSDAIFFASHNHGRFLLKTLRGAEPDNLKGFLSDYLGHIHKHPNTLLPRYLGMYTFEKLAGSKLATTAAATGGTDGAGLGATGMSFGGGGDREGSGVGGAAGGAASRNKSDATAAQHLHLNGTLLSGRDDGLPSKLVVVVLANVFDTPEVVHERYDFKGSNVGRRTLPVPVDGVAVRESRSLNPIVPDLQPRASMDRDSGWGDFAHRHPQWRTHQLATPTTGESRASSMYYEPKSDPIYPHLQSGGLGTGRTTTSEGEGGVGAAVTDISHLTLKEMDFQNRIFTGETQLIHLGSTRKAEVLAQLEEDTSLLRKHGFMDYSMLVGIRILPKRPAQEEVEGEEEDMPQIYSSPESSRRGSVSSRGSDADGSNLDSDMEGGSSIHDSLNSDALNKRSDSKHEIEEVLGRIWKFITLSTEERLEFFKGLGEKAQEAFRDVYSFGEVIVSRGGGQGSDLPSTPTPTLDASTTRSATKSGSRKDSNKDTSRALPPPEVELTAVKSDRSKRHNHHHSRKHKGREQQEEQPPRRPLFEDDDDDNDNDIIDPDSFQTVRYKPRTDSRSSIRPKLSILINSTTTSRKPTLETAPRHQSMPGGLPILPHHPVGPPTAGTGAGEASRLYSSPPCQQSAFPHHGAEAPTGKNLHDPNQLPTIWSQGVPSLNLPDGYEAVYYFGLIDVLQKYNLVKWLERNIKGANVRLLGSGGGGGGGSCSPMTPGPPSSVPTVIHPGRSNPSTSSSFASSAFYQLLPHATASEPSLPSPAMDSTSAVAAAAATAAGTNATLSVLHENPSSGRASTSSSSTTTSSSRDPSSNRGSLLLDPNSSSYSQSSVSTPISSARVSQEESTLSSASTTAPMMIKDDSGKTLASFTSTSHSPSPSFSSPGQQQQQLRARLSSSAPFTKSIAGARLSQYSQYSHSSQQSQHSHQSGRSRDSRLSFDIRASNASESMMLPHHLLSSSSSSSPPSDSGSGGVQIHIPPGQATQATQTQTQMHQHPPQLQHQHSKSHVLQYQVPQHAEVSVEEPGRYAERLIDFMRGVLI
ncbi:Phosphatidylinositol 4-phosphate 5-kinase 9 [Mortierella sp. 14UC]|nr:Phosphatidylinositol 4-phosphate 5-kinase 9 [Mortierella sp. 14UC]